MAAYRAALECVPDARHLPPGRRRSIIWCSCIGKVGSPACRQHTSKRFNVQVRGSPCLAPSVSPESERVCRKVLAEPHQSRSPSSEGKLETWKQREEPLGLEPGEVSVRRSFYPLVEKAGVTRTHFHDLRHTVARLMKKAGVSTSGISETFGHESESTTDDFYGHDVPELKQQAIDALERALKKPGEEDQSQSKPQSI